MNGDGEQVLTAQHPIVTSNGFTMRLFFGGPTFDPDVTKKPGYLIVRRLSAKPRRVMICPCVATESEGDEGVHIVTIQVDTFHLDEGCFQVVDLSWLGDAKDDGPNPAFGVEEQGAEQLRTCVFLHMGSGAANAGSLQGVGEAEPNS